MPLDARLPFQSPPAHRYLLRPMPEWTAMPFTRTTSPGYGTYKPNTATANSPLQYNNGYSISDADRNSADFYVDNLSFYRHQ